MQPEFEVTIWQWLTAQPNIKEKTHLQNGRKISRIFVYFFLKDVFSCNYNYMDYSVNKGGEGRGNYCWCYGLVLSVSQKNK